MLKPPLTFLNTLVVLIVVSLLATTITGCGDRDTAGELVEESERLRQSATDQFRLQTVAIDTLISTVASGKSLLVNEIETTADTAAQEYAVAIADLEARSGKLDQASELSLNESYKEYLRLLSASNEKLIEALTAAADIPQMINADKSAFAGWNEIRAAEVLSAIEARQLQIDLAYEEAETLRAQAEKLREDNREEFE
jgi:hypothetical protein